MSQQNIDKIGPARADFTATAASLMFQAQPMLFDLQEFFVKRKNFGGTLFAGDGKLVFCVREDLFEMARHGHYRS